jgi:hypothetical protein
MGRRRLAGRKKRDYNVCCALLAVAFATGEQGVAGTSRCLLSLASRRRCDWRARCGRQQEVSRCLLSLASRRLCDGGLGVAGSKK